MSVIVKEMTAGVTSLSLNRPEKRNALNAALIHELLKTLEQLAQDKKQRVLLIRGEGPLFCAGLDLMEENSEIKELLPLLYKTLYHSPLVTCAVVQGAAIGGGVGLLACSDYVIADSKAKLGCPETRRGLVAAHILPYLKRKLHPCDLRAFLLSAQMNTAQQGFRAGLVNEIAEEGTLLSQALKFAKEVLQGAPQATRLTKRLFEELAFEDLDREIAITSKYGFGAFSEEEYQEGRRAFLEKRPPKWAS